MKVRVLVEVLDRGGKARRLNHVEVSSKTRKLYESISPGPEVMAFIADDVMTAALKAVQERSTPQAALETQAKLPGKDEQGKATGNTMLEDTLGLGIVEQMLEKDGAGAQVQPFSQGGIQGLPPLPPVRR